MKKFQFLFAIFFAAAVCVITADNLSDVSISPTGDATMLIPKNGSGSVSLTGKYLL